ncbi:response regulator transcription factor, partial [Shewanella algae]|uniref:response regulator transcription factor n=2 Tax=Pseudomonadota TaxID=1224 RepID=UPI00313CE1BB
MTHILVVEDDPGSADAIAAILHDEGMDVAHADNAAQAFLLARDTDFDGIVLDRMLPGGIDGIGLLDMLRAHGATTPVLIL